MSISEAERKRREQRDRRNERSWRLLATLWVEVSVVFSALLTYILAIDLFRGIPFLALVFLPEQAWPAAAQRFTHPEATHVVLATVAGVVPLVTLGRWRDDNAIRRHWMRACIKVGLGDRPPDRSDRHRPLTGPRIVRIRRVLSGRELTVRMEPGQPLEHLEKEIPALEATLRTHLAFKRVLNHPEQAIVTFYQDPFFDAPPLPWPLLDEKEASVWSPLPLGIREDGTPVLWSTMGGHVLIVGTTNTGKSVAVNLFVAQAALDPKARVYLLDNKYTELGPWEDVAEALVTDDMQAAVDLLRGLQDLVADRNRELRQHRGRQAKPGDVTHHLIIDEASWYCLHADSKLAKEFNAALLDLVQRGRSVGLRVILATQRPHERILDTNVRAQMSHRLCFRTDATAARMVFDGDVPPVHDLDPDGHKGVCFTSGHGMRTERQRTYFLSLEAVAAIVARARLLRPPPIRKPLSETASGPERGDTRQAVLQALGTANGDGMGREALLSAAGRPGDFAPTLKALLASGEVRRQGKGVRGDPFLYRRLDSQTSDSTPTG